MPAEMLRDQALSLSGLLVGPVGGPSVKPYQPAGLWKEIATDVEYGQGHGADLYRRSLYTYWKRTVAPPTMVTFDGPARETCIARRSRTNTPLQALALMNDVTFVEAARKLAERTLREGGSDSQQRLTWMFRLLTSRPPRAAELAVLETALARHLDKYREQPAQAAALLGEGESPRDMTLDVAEFAAYTTLGNMLLNLDEVVTKE
jgi:hypothetical protein